MDRITEKPWGHEELLEHNTRYALKKIFIRAGCRTSLQYHRSKCETNYVVSGDLDVERGTSMVKLAAGADFTVLPMQHHRITAVTNVTIIECSTPELDDVVRIEDDYGRGTPTAAQVRTLVHEWAKRVDPQHDGFTAWKAAQPEWTDAAVYRMLKQLAKLPLREESTR